MAETQQTEGIIDVQKSDAPAQSEATKTPDEKAGGHGLNPDGPAPPTSLPPSMIQEENTKHLSVLPAANVPQVVVEGNPRMVTPLERLTPQEAWIDCPFCQHTTKTRITKEGDSQQTLASVICCLICLPLACIPCIAGWCENTHIFCTRCGRKVATIPHDGPIQVVPVGQQEHLVPSKYVAQPGMK
ncbi:hypothetical protein F4680DRAFT_221498 [Xylaria scruposa]|nr:hypothetical protein F4680DRAFT_221498 [Xylaria scruposa]